MNKPDKKSMEEKIKEILLSLDLGYTYQMSDYATSTQQEDLFEKEGLAQVDKATKKLLALFTESLKGMEAMQMEDEFEVGFYKNKMIGRIRKTGEEIPLRMQLRQVDRNDLRQEIISEFERSNK